MPKWKPPIEFQRKVNAELRSARKRCVEILEDAGFPEKAEIAEAGLHQRGRPRNFKFCSACYGVKLCRRCKRNAFMRDLHARKKAALDEYRAKDLTS